MKKVLHRYSFLVHRQSERVEGIDIFALVFLPTTGLSYIALYKLIIRYISYIIWYFTHTCIYLSTFVSINPNTPKFHITKTCRSVYHDFFITAADRSSFSNLIDFVAAVIAVASTPFSPFSILFFFFFVAFYLRRHLVTHPRSQFLRLFATHVLSD